MNRYRLFVISLLVFPVLAIAWLAFAFFFGGTQGQEFSPYSFSTRRFTYFRFPSKTVVQPMGLACSLDVSKYLGASLSAQGIDRWDLQSCDSDRPYEQRMEASLLVDFLEQTKANSGDSVWGEWSKENPELATELWPAVQTLAIHRAYFVIPELMQVAATKPSKKKMREAIQRLSLRAAMEQTEHEVAQGLFSQALQTLRWGRSLGDDEAWDPLEAEIRRGLGAEDRSSVPE